jgi:multidrug resistance protein
MTRPLYLVSLAAFLMMTGLSVIFPVLPFYVRWLSLSEAQAGVLMSAYALASVATSPLWGRFSERYGRRPALLIGLGGFALTFAWFGLGSSFGELLLARVFGGLLAAAAQPAIFAYAADVSSKESRTAAMGVVGAAFGLGIVAGPVLGGLLAPLGLRVPFLVTAAIGLLAMMAVWLLVPESLTEEVRAQTQIRREALERSGLGLRRLAVALLALLVFSFLFQTARMGLESTIGFLIEDRLAGDARSVGLLLGGLGLLAAAVQGGGMRALSRRYSDATLLVVGSACCAVGLFGLALAHGWPSITVASVAIALGGALVTPALSAMLSQVDEAVQGEAQGLNQSAQSLGRVLGPLLFTSLYDVAGTVAPYLVAAVVCALALGMAARGLRVTLRIETPT